MRLAAKLHGGMFAKALPVTSMKIGHMDIGIHDVMQQSEGCIEACRREVPEPCGPHVSSSEHTA